MWVPPLLSDLQNNRSTTLVVSPVPEDTELLHYCGSLRQWELPVLLKLAEVYWSVGISCPICSFCVLAMWMCGCVCLRVEARSGRWVFSSVTVSYF